MNNSDSKIGSALAKVLRSDTAIGVGKEYLELGIDSMLESGAFKDIPFVNSVVAIFNVAGTVRDHLLVTKLIRFLNQLSGIPIEQRTAMVEKLNEDDKFSGKVGSAVIEILDRMESEKKPELAAKCFAAYAKEEISFEELRRILLALERVPSFDIDKLVGFSEAAFENRREMDESMLIAFVNSGLGVNNGGLDGGTVVPTGLCKLFLKVGIAS